MPSSLPLTHEGRYGSVTLDHAACGRGYVVDFRASEWVQTNWGRKSRWATFDSLHAALAFFWGLSGLHERRPPGNEAGGRVKGSRNAVRTTLDAPGASEAPRVPSLSIREGMPSGERPSLTLRHHAQSVQARAPVQSVTPHHGVRQGSTDEHSAGPGPIR